MASYGHELMQDLKVSGAAVILYRSVRMIFFLKEGVAKCPNEINNKLISTRQHNKYLFSI